MSNYAQITSFGPKDALITGNPAKLIKGSEIDPELAAISAAIQSKLDAASLATEVGTQQIQINTNSPLANTIGLRGIPMVADGVGTFTFKIEHMGKAALHGIGAGPGDTWTIPANSAVPFPVGATLTMINVDNVPVTLQINSDTMWLMGSGALGTRTLQPMSIATAVKVGATFWVLSGVNIT